MQSDELVCMSRPIPLETADSIWRRIPWRIVGAVLVALLLRLYFVSSYYKYRLDPRIDYWAMGYQAGHWSFPYRPGGVRDHWAFGYETGRIARAIASGHGFSDPMPAPSGPTADLGPVFPSLVAGVFKLFGIYSKTSLLVLLTLNSLFSAATCIPIFHLAEKSVGRWAATGAAWAWALYPSCIFLIAQMIWETYLSTLLLTCLIVWALYIGSSLWEWTAFGLLWGILILSSPNTLVLLPILAGWGCFRLSKNRQKWALRALICALMVFLVVLPWEVRNYRVFGHVVPIRDNFWLEFHLANNGGPVFCTEHVAHPACNDDEAVELSAVGEARYMAHKRAQAIDFVSHHPGWFLAQTLRRIAFLWTGFWRLDGEWFGLEKPFDPFWFVSTVLMIFGMRNAFRQQMNERWLYLLIILIFPLPYYLMAPVLRYRQPIDPVILVLSAYGAKSCLEAWKDRRLRQSAREAVEVPEPEFSEEMA